MSSLNRFKHKRLVPNETQTKPTTGSLENHPTELTAVNNAVKSITQDAPTKVVKQVAHYNEVSKPNEVVKPNEVAQSNEVVKPNEVTKPADQPKIKQIALKNNKMSESQTRSVQATDTPNTYLQAAAKSNGGKLHKITTVQGVKSTSVVTEAERSAAIMEQIMRKAIGKSAEYVEQFADNLSQPSKSAEIISKQPADSKNMWKEFLCVEKTNSAAFLPSKDGNLIGYNLHAFDNVVLQPFSKVVLNLKIKIHMPPNVYGRIASVSNFAAVHDIDINGGVIDQDHQGEIHVVLRNYGPNQFMIKKGMKIAQLILEKYSNVPVKEVSSIIDLFYTAGKGSLNN